MALEATWIMDINRDSSYSRTVDPDIALGSVGVNGKGYREERMRMQYLLIETKLIFQKKRVPPEQVTFHNQFLFCSVVEQDSKQQFFIVPGSAPLGSSLGFTG